MIQIFGQRTDVNSSRWEVWLNQKLRNVVSLWTVLINYVKRKNLDTTKYDKAVRRAYGSRVYACHWYLDIVTQGQWGALVFDDYYSVMPLPFNRKYFGIPQVYRPILTQQLGVFAENPNPFHVWRYINRMPRRFRKIHLPMTQESYVRGLKEKTNLTLDINRPYEEIEAGYSKSLRKNLRKANDIYHMEKSTDVDLLVDMYRAHLEDKVHFGEKNYSIAHKLFTKLVDNGCGQLWQVKKDNEVVATGIFPIYRARVYNIFAVSAPDAPNAMAYLIDQMIRMNKRDGGLFDFEGSEVPGIQEFFKSFGAKYDPYYLYIDHKFPFNETPDDLEHYDFLNPF